MRAVRMHAYGGPEVLKVDEIPVPEPGPGEVCVRIHASSVNPIDWKIRSGGQRGIIRYALPRTLGLDLSGEISALGSGVTDLKIGDEVWSSPHHTAGGTYAEYAVLPASQLGLKPVSLSHQEAAALPLVGLTAYEALVTKAKLQPGERVFIQAGSGGVGHIAIQIAKAMGAQVLTTCSTRNLELATSFGADKVIDYTKEDFEALVKDVDVALEALGGASRQRTLSVIRRGGRMSCIVGDIPQHVKRHGPAIGVPMAVLKIAGFVVQARMRRGVRVYQVVRPPVRTRLDQLAALVEAGKVRPHIDRTFPLAELSKAHSYSETGRVRGKIVISMT